MPWKETSSQDGGEQGTEASNGWWFVANPREETPREVEALLSLEEHQHSTRYDEAQALPVACISDDARLVRRPSSFLLLALLIVDYPEQLLLWLLLLLPAVLKLPVGSGRH